MQVSGGGGGKRGGGGGKRGGGERREFMTMRGVPVHRKLARYEESGTSAPKDKPHDMFTRGSR